MSRNLDELKKLALEMGRYYYKGFGNTISGILSNVEKYLISQKR